MNAMRDEKGFKNVECNVVSEYLASVSIVGPNSRAVLAELGKGDVSDEAFPPGTTKLLRLAAVPCIACRQGVTGNHE